jgi:hypothetical protein
MEPGTDRPQHASREQLGPRRQPDASGSAGDAVRHLVAELLVSTRELERAARDGDLDRVSIALDRRLDLLSTLLSVAAPRQDQRLTRPLGLAERRAARALAALTERRDLIAAELDQIGVEVRREDAYLPPRRAPSGFWLDLAS